ncbi:hypothetical protein VTK73DRAFT_6567 [Phialemonium thermophilum]|uniref:Serine hydrolase domain-containing protein n=1 Tax=Phialemonium thermophilum TaxID=223376 RepID=A0ABR3WJE6_9PEZI
MIQRCPPAFTTTALLRLSFNGKKFRLSTMSPLDSAGTAPSADKKRPAKNGKKEVKILMLHGYTQSGPLFRAKTRALEKALQKGLAPLNFVPKLIYPTGPNRLSARDVPGYAPDEDGNDRSDAEIDSWAWFRKDEATGSYRLLGEGMKRIAETIREEVSSTPSLAAESSNSSSLLPSSPLSNPSLLSASSPQPLFTTISEGSAATLADKDLGGDLDTAPSCVGWGGIDGVIGFSQGACMASMLTAALETVPGKGVPRVVPGGEEETSWNWVEDVRQANRGAPLRFAVLYSGFAAQPKALTWLYEPPIGTPTVHFLGSLDTVVDEGRSRELIDRCADPAVIVHPGGHYVPVSKEWVAPLVGFIQKSVRDNLQL